MKPTTYVLVGSLAAGLSLSVSGAWAAPGGAASGLVIGGLAMSQSTPPAESSKRSEAERLLRLAREAIARGDLAEAERWAAQAESLNARYDQIYERFVDTPAKVRATIADRRAAASGTPPRPSQRFSPSTTASAPGPRVTVAATPRSNRDSQAQLDLLTNDATSRARAFLEKGRLAMQQGDLTGAVAWRQKALATGAQFAPGEYSPEALAQELRRAGVPEERLARAPADHQSAAARPDDFAADPLGTLPAARSREPLGGGPNPNAAYPVARSATPASAPQATTGAAEPRRLPQPVAAVLTAKSEVLRLLAQAQAALDRGDARTARQLVQRAQALGVPDEAFGPNEPRPEHLLLLVNSALNRQMAAGGPPGHPVAQAYDPGTGTPGQYPVRQSLYEPARDGTRNVLAQSAVPSTLADPHPAGPVPPTPSPASSTLGPPNQPSPGHELYQKGIQALEQQDRKTALELFTEAWKHEAELDSLTRQALRDKLTLLRSASPPPGTALAEVSAQQQMLSNKLFRDISRELSSADKLRESDPRGALQRLQKLREQVEQENLDPPARKQYLTMIDRGLRETELYLEQHRGDIELKERNKAAAESIDRWRQEKMDVQTKVAQLNEEFNNLMDQKRYAEAEVKAKQASELEPQSEVVRSMLLTSRLAHRVQEQEEIKDAKEKGFYEALTGVDRSSIPFDDSNPLQYDAKNWEKLSRGRADRFRRDHSRLTPTELEIQKSLKTPVEARFENRPLSEVVDALGRMAGVNVYLDPEGLRAEGIGTDEAVTINLSRPVSLRSALNLILEPLRLGYVIQNEVLRITSAQRGNSDVYPRVYNVADLVIPIPNFMPGYNVGMAGALREAQSAGPYGLGMGGTQSMPLLVASQENKSGAGANASVLAQMSSSGMLPSTAPRSPHPLGMSPGNMGGATQADFDTLIDLITATIAPTTWDTVGGPGSIEGFPTNLSLVISQTQEVHEQIADLLDQLRRLQDLQVTIEVRYITLNDKFFERLGVSFDFKVDDNSNQIAGNALLVPDDTGPSIAYGLDPTGNPTVDFDYTFRQQSFGATPPFGGYDPTTAANIGFAILSDIEVFLLLQAAEGDNRTNVLQAPKVTLFNGQFGLVMDVSQRPFVMSVVPVVGDFAAAHQPVVVVLNEGTSLSVQAVVSPDRRFVRLTMIPFFSSIGDVSTFTFNGRRTSDTGTVVVDPANNQRAVRNNENNFIEGTTVQLPTFNVTTVSTTVSVPDGGTILMGGIKRLSEGRNERGVPMLSKIPYLNRLFKNVGIGRETQSLMMMVTPRIIIQEEEEFQQTGYDSSQQ